MLVAIACWDARGAHITVSNRFDFVYAVSLDDFIKDGVEFVKKVDDLQECFACEQASFWTCNGVDAADIDVKPTTSLKKIVTAS